MEKPNLNKKSFWIGTTCWAIFLVTLTMSIAKSKLMNESPALANIITLFIIGTILAGFVSLIGLIFSIVAYQHEKDQTREFIISFTLNLSYIVIDVFFTVQFIKLILMQ
ncbi:hypothetical protein [Desulforamulus aeronauticus]|uniref:Uncharacterized protein n=1 Tax=Desulforamulus aeronauticus DSM 10349 TaxID=1121421 RepID=A0A1M6XEE8_9FIRM|nr:hypothetical protein [Desulforamulus aeronauticus]SHL04229.1 hypothetical protein SAMN02745123_03998 [Desulforamulus aeronauticus DSM 10349]